MVFVRKFASFIGIVVALFAVQCFFVWKFVDPRSGADPLQDPSFVLLIDCVTALLLTWALFIDVATAPIRAVVVSFLGFNWLMFALSWVLISDPFSDRTAGIVGMAIMDVAFIAMALSKAISHGRERLRVAVFEASRIVDGEKYDMAVAQLVDKRLLAKDGALFRLLGHHSVGDDDEPMNSQELQHVAGAVATLAGGAHWSALLKALGFVFRLRMVFLCRLPGGGWFVVLNPGLQNDFRPISGDVARKLLEYKPGTYGQYFDFIERR